MHSNHTDTLVQHDASEAKAVDELIEHYPHLDQLMAETLMRMYKLQKLEPLMNEANVEEHERAESHTDPASMDCILPEAISIENVGT